MSESLLECDAPPEREVPVAHRCERCGHRQAWFQVSVVDELIKSCAQCLSAHERREIDEARREAEYEKLHPRDVISSEGANLQ